MALALLACADPSGTTDDAGSPAPCEGVPAADLDALFAQHLDAMRPTGCTANGCHGTGAGGLTFKNAHELWAATVGRPSLGGGGRQLVVPGEPASSFLFAKMLPSAPNRMPMGGPPLDDAALKSLAGWICAGAPEPAAPDGGAPVDGGSEQDGGVVGDLAIDDFSPTSGLAGTQVTISGRGFDPAAEGNDVRFGTARATVATASATSLVVSVPAGAASGPITVRAFGVTATSAGSFAVIEPNPVPSLVALDPSTIEAGAAATTLMLQGAQFIATSTALWDGVALPTTRVDGAHLSASLDATLLAGAGEHALSVVTPGPGGGTTAPLPFSVRNPSPQIVAVRPTALPVGGGPVTIVVEGTGIVADTRLSIDGQDVIPAVRTATRIEWVADAAFTALAAGHTVQLHNPAPGGGTSATATVVVENPVPVLSAIAPASVLRGEPLVTLVATGSGFVSTSRLTVDGVPFGSSFHSAGSVEAVLPGTLLVGPAIHLIAVESPRPGGGRSNELTFTVANPAPVVTSTAPAVLKAGQPDAIVVLAGSGFVPETSVSAAGSALSVTATTPTTATVIVPQALFASTGMVSLQVSNAAPGGGSTTVTIPVENPLPVLVALSQEATLATGAAVTLTAGGQDFVPGSVVLLDGNRLATTFLSSGGLSFVVPASVQAVGGVHAIVVETPSPGGGRSAALTYTVQNPAPSIGGLSPATVAEGGAPFTLTISGTGFNTASVVRLDNDVVASALVDSATITASMPTLTLGGHTISVTNPAPGGGSDQSTLSATASALPSITSLSPAVAASGAAFSLMIGGANFRCTGPQASSVDFGGVVLAVTSCTSTQLVVSVPARSAGAYNVIVKNGAQSSGAATCTLVDPRPVPAIAALSPTFVASGDAGVTLQVTGTGFAADSSVRVGGSARTTTFVSSTRLDATLGSGDLANVGTLSITVFTPAPGGGTSGAASFEVRAPNPVPVLSSISPASIAAGSPATTLTLTGSSFVNGAEARWNGSARPTTFTGPTSLSMSVSAQDLSAAGTATITVVNPTPGGGTSGSASFTIVALNPAPSITSLSPTSIAAGSGGFALTIQGSGFIAGSTATFDGRARSVTFGSSTQLSVTIPSSDVAVAGSFPVVVTNPAPGGGSSAPASFSVTVSNPVPALSSASPSSVVAGSGAVSVALTGTGFLASSTATVDGASRTVHFTSATQLAVDLLAADTQTAGSRAIVVTNPSPGGGSSAPLVFTVVAPNPLPVVDSISPAAIPVGSSATTLTVNGSGFVAGSAVKLGAVSKSTTFVSATRLDAALSSADLANAGSFDVTVVSPSPGGGTSAIVKLEVTNPAPVLASVSPASVAAGSGAVTITLNGSGFVAGSSAQWDGAARTTRFVNATQLAADLLATDVASAGSHTLTVVNAGPGGGTSTSVAFTVTAAANPAPTISSLSPCGRVAGQGAFTLTINGSGFTSGTTVTFAGTAVTPTLISATQLTASIPAPATSNAPANGAATVQVVNASPGGGSSSATFGIASQAVTSAQVQTVISNRCASCHGFSTTAWKDKPSSSCPSTPYIKSCGPLNTQSYVISRITNTASCGGTNRMPPGSPLSASDQQLIIDWAAQGAP